MNRKHRLLIAAAALAATGGTALGASEQPTVAGFPSNYLTINASTCKFEVPEIDLRFGRTWLIGQKQVAQDDARHDVLDQCLRRRPSKPGPAGPAGPRGRRGLTGAAGIGALDGYIQVSASGTGAVVTVSCPTGDVVLGGGSASETAGSWPSSTSAWSVGRDHLSPHLLSVVATCARSAS